MGTFLDKLRGRPAVMKGESEASRRFAVLKGESEARRRNAVLKGEREASRRIAVWKGEREASRRMRPNTTRELRQVEGDEGAGENSTLSSRVSFGDRDTFKFGNDDNLKTQTMQQYLVLKNRSAVANNAFPKPLLNKIELRFSKNYQHVPASRDPFMVDSCFGGATLYDPFRWKEEFLRVVHDSYKPLLPLTRTYKLPRETCEHVSFHLDMNKALESRNGGPQLMLQPKFLTAGIQNREGARERWGRYLKFKEDAYFSSWKNESLAPYYGRYLQALQMGPENMAAALPTQLEKVQVENEKTFKL